MAEIAPSPGRRKANKLFHGYFSTLKHQSIDKTGQKPHLSNSKKRINGNETMIQLEHALRAWLSKGV